ncbi:MAG: tetratricopeptide repeat protein, partial [Methanothrix sp.]
MTRKFGALALLLACLVLLLVLHSALGNDSYLRKNCTFVEYNASELLAFTLAGPSSMSEDAYHTVERRADKIKSDIEVGLDIEAFDQIRPRLIPLIGDSTSGSLNIKQICNIYDYMCGNWGYINDPRGLDWFQNATYTMKMGDLGYKMGFGDCDDFAILMASFIENIGGATTVVLASDPGRSGHVYAEVYLGRLGQDEENINSIIEWLRKKYSNQDIGYDIPDPASGEVWLCLDYNALCPGGPPVKMARNIPLVLRGEMGKRALMPWEEALAKRLPTIPELPQKESDYELNYLLRDATALREAGEYEGAIKGYEEIIKTTSPTEYPYEYGSALNGIGLAYNRLAQVKDKEKYLRKAISSCKEALKIFTVESYPIDYASTQNNLGNAYGSLADVRDKETNLMLAIEACREALKIYTVES